MNIQISSFTYMYCILMGTQDQDQDSNWWNAETTITHQDLWLGN